MKIGKYILIFLLIGVAYAFLARISRLVVLNSLGDESPTDMSTATTVTIVIFIIALLINVFVVPKFLRNSVWKWFFLWVFIYSIPFPEVSYLRDANYDSKHQQWISKTSIKYYTTFAENAFDVLDVYKDVVDSNHTQIKMHSLEFVVEIFKLSKWKWIQVSAFLCSMFLIYLNVCVYNKKVYWDRIKKVFSNKEE